MDIPKQPSLPEIRNRIAQLKRIRQTAEIDFLKTRLELLFRGYAISAPILMPDQMLYRGVPWGEKPSSATKLSYPPAKVITNFQRVNRPHQPMFYCSAARAAPFFELGLRSGECVAISKWRVTKKILVNHVGYRQGVFNRLRSNRATPDWKVEHPRVSSGTNKLVANFFASEFSCVVPQGQEYLYKISIAIAEKLYQGNLHMDSVGEEFDGERRFGGILYPTLAMRANSDNVALLPEFADRYLRLESVEWVRVDSVSDDFNNQYQITMLDFASSFGEGGEIEWKGRPPQWTVPAGATFLAAVENGKWVVRNQKGEIVEPM